MKGPKKKHKTPFKIAHFLAFPFLLKDLLGEDKGRVSTASCPPLQKLEGNGRFRNGSSIQKKWIAGILKNQYPSIGHLWCHRIRVSGICKTPGNLVHTQEVLPEAPPVP